MPFKKGDTRINREGRPKGSKNKLTLVKDKIVAIANKKLNDPNVIKELSGRDLVRFIASIAPKDIGIDVTPTIQFITRAARPKMDWTPINEKTIEKQDESQDMIEDNQGREHDNPSKQQ